MTALLVISVIFITIFIFNRAFSGAVNKKISYQNVINDPFLRKAEHKRCLKCGKEPQNLHWYKFRSSNASWRHLAGVAGYYSECPDCSIRVDNIITVRN